jgi:signal transduction histidine kinase
MALACSWIALDHDLSREPVNWLLICISLLLSFLQISCLFMGALALRRRATPGHDLRQVFLVGAISLGLLVFLCSFLLRADAPVSFAVRSFARCIALAAAYLYAAFVVARHMHYQTSRGARFVAWSCAAYAVVAAIEAWNAVLVGSFEGFSILRQNLFVLDGACETLMTLSMVLLLVERSRRFHQRLELYESILPTCAVCGSVRDDAHKGRGRGGWMPLEEFVRKYSPARFSHGVCPKCMDVQMEYARRARSEIAS